MENQAEPKSASSVLPSAGPQGQLSTRPAADPEGAENILGDRGDRYDLYRFATAFNVIRRQPLHFHPRSIAAPNYGLLPDGPAMAGMDLAFRKEVLVHASPVSRISRSAGELFLLWTAIAFGTILLGRLCPVNYLAYAAAGVMVLCVAIYIVPQRATGRHLLLALIIPPLVLIAMKAVSLLFIYRFLGAAVFGALAAGAAIRWGSLPFTLYLEWLYTHPRLKPETRRSGVPVSPPLDFLLLGIVLLLVVFGPILSSALTLVALVILAAVMLAADGWKDIWDAPRFGSAVLATFMLCGGPGPSEPGVWHPPMPRKHRLAIAAALVGAFLFALTSGLTLFVPLSDLIKWDLVSDAEKEKAAMDGPVWEPTEWWIRYAYRKCIDENEQLYLATVPFSLAVGAVLPPLVLAAIFRKPLRHALAEHRRVEGVMRPDGSRTPGLDDDGRPEWQWYVDRLRLSRHSATGPLGQEVREAEHFFMGVEPHARFPVLLDRRILAEHAYIVGDSGSGKTSLGIMPLLIQLIRGHRDPVSGQSPCPPIVVLDLKGDPALFNTVRAEAEANGHEFRFFTPERGRVSHYFNPFAGLDSPHRSDIQLGQILLDALGLNHGEGYGRGYYSRQSRSLLLAAMQGTAKPGDHSDATRRPGSIDELHRALLKFRDSDPAIYQDTLELLSTVHALSQYPMLAMRTDPSHPHYVIHMPSVLERRQIVYFWLPAAIESVSVREIGKLALYSLLTACIDRQRTRPDSPRQAYVFIDEFQRIAGENFRVILEQGRSYGLGMVLANQSIADLRTPDVDLRPTVRTNTRLKRYFSVTDPEEIKTLSDLSGEEIMFLAQWSRSAQEPYLEYVALAYQNKSDSQALKKRMLFNDIVAASDHPLDSILHVSRGSGYTQFAGVPLHVRCTWPMTKSTYAARLKAPWPTQDQYPEGTTTWSTKSPVDIDRDRAAEFSKMVLEKLAAMEQDGPFQKAQTRNAQNA